MTKEELLGVQIKTRREIIGISQEELASRSNLHRTYIGSIERGERNVSLKNILKICEALNTKPSELFKAFDK